MSKQIKPCPFCGNENINFFINTSNDGVISYQFTCTECRALIAWPLKAVNDLDQITSDLLHVVIMWNTRATEQKSENKNKKA